MGIETAIIVGAVAAAASAGLQVKAGIDARNEAKHQAGIAREQAQIAASNERTAADRAARAQKVAYLKSGVTLEGSPLLLMQETYMQGEKNAQNTIRTGYAQARAVKAQGDQAFTGGLASGFQTVGSAVLQGYQLSSAGGQAPATPTAPASLKG